MPQVIQGWALIAVESLDDVGLKRCCCVSKELSSHLLPDFCFVAGGSRLGSAFFLRELEHNDGYNDSHA
jgi:hypothetical protein